MSTYNCCRLPDDNFLTIPSEPQESVPHRTTSECCPFSTSSILREIVQVFLVVGQLAVSLGMVKTMFLYTDSSHFDQFQYTSVERWSHVQNIFPLSRLNSMQVVRQGLRELVHRQGVSIDLLP